MQRSQGSIAGPSASAVPPSSSSSSSRVVCTDYKLVSPNPQSYAWQHNIMRLHAPTATSSNSNGSIGGREQRNISLASWDGPVKLNRRNERKIIEDRERKFANAIQTDGNNNAQTSGQNAQQKQQQQQTEERENNRKFFKRKTQRVYQNEGDYAERVRRQERDPWLLEDVATDDQWAGRLDGTIAAEEGKSSGYVLFVMENGEDGDTLSVIPVNRSYRFTQRPNFVTLGADRAEEEYSRMQKATTSGMTRWGMRHANSNAAAQAAVKPDVRDGGKTDHKDMNARDRVAYNLQRLRVTENADSGADSRKGRNADDDLWGSDDEEDVKPKVKNDAQEDYEDLEYEEEFDDDEEGIGVVGDDTRDQEENKDIQERLKQEMRSYNRNGWEGGEDLESDEDKDKLDKGGKRAKKLLKKLREQRRKQNEMGENDDYDDYDDDDDNLSNPYASDAQESSDLSSGGEELERALNDSAKPPDSTQARQTKPAPRLSQPVSRSNSRSGSPTLGRHGSGVHSRRAPVSSRTGSPALEDGSSRQGTPSSRLPSSGPESSSNLKRKGSVEDSVDSKRMKQVSSSPPPNDDWLITDDALREYIKKNGKVATRDILRHFKTHLRKDPRNKAGLQAQLTRVAHYDKATGILSVE